MRIYLFRFLIDFQLGFANRRDSFINDGYIVPGISRRYFLKITHYRSKEEYLFKLCGAIFLHIFKICERSAVTSVSHSWEWCSLHPRVIHSSGNRKNHATYKICGARFIKLPHILIVFLHKHRARVVTLSGRFVGKENK